MAAPLSTSADATASDNPIVAAVLAGRAICDMRRAAARARRDCCGDPYGARLAFAAFTVPEGERRALDPLAAAWARVVLFGAGVRCEDLAVALDGSADMTLGDQAAQKLLTGRRAVSADEWRRLRALVEQLEAEEAERARADQARGPHDSIAAAAVGVLLDRLARPQAAPRCRKAVDAELVGFAMNGALVEEEPATCRPDPLAFVVRSAGCDTAVLFLP